MVTAATQCRPPLRRQPLCLIPPTRSTATEARARRKRLLVPGHGIAPRSCGSRALRLSRYCEGISKTLFDPDSSMQLPSVAGSSSWSIAAVPPPTSTGSATPPPP